MTLKTANNMPEFEALVHPLVKWLNDNYDPYSAILITPDRAQLFEGLIALPINDYIKD